MQIIRLENLKRRAGGLYNILLKRNVVSILKYTLSEATRLKNGELQKEPM